MRHGRGRVLSGGGFVAGAPQSNANSYMTAINVIHIINRNVCGVDCLIIIDMESMKCVLL